MDVIWVALALCMFLGCMVQTAMGFGAAVVVAPVMVLLKPEWVPYIITVNVLFISLFISWRSRDALQIRELAPAFIARIPGAALGAWLLLQVDVVMLQLIVALSVLLAVAVSLFNKQFESTPTRLGAAAFVSGVLGTATAIGGPPMALVMQHGSPDTVRANLALYFAYSCVIGLLSYYFSGLLDVNLLIDSAGFLPVSLAGVIAGRKLRGFVDAGRFRSMLLLLCTASGLVALVGAIAKW
ncbi:MAG: hypothetical protein COA42_09305 [Alteromonadaceae bacterium]|nr:MAG: hypothetical protein COA42_09305 [Alteromonadaceae bacterium]